MATHEFTSNGTWYAGTYGQKENTTQVAWQTNDSDTGTIQFFGYVDGLRVALPNGSFELSQNDDNGNRLRMARINIKGGLEVELSNYSGSSLIVATER